MLLGHDEKHRLRSVPFFLGPVWQTRSHSRLPARMIFHLAPVLLALADTARLSFGPRLPRQLPSFTMALFFVSSVLALFRRQIPAPSFPTKGDGLALGLQFRQPARAPCLQTLL